MRREEEVLRIMDLDACDQRGIAWEFGESADETLLVRGPGERKWSLVGPIERAGWDAAVRRDGAVIAQNERHTGWVLVSQIDPPPIIPDFPEVSDLAPGIYDARYLNPPSGDDCTHLLVREDGSLGWCDSRGIQSAEHSFTVAELLGEDGL